MPISPEQVALRPAVPADADFVVAVAEASIRPYAEQAFGTWDQELVRARFTPETCFIVVVGGEPAGTMDVVETADQIQLNVLYLLPPFRNRGVGAALLEQLVARAAAVAKPVRLRVLRVNPARRFYERHGFAVYAEAPERFFMERQP